MVSEAISITDVRWQCLQTVGTPRGSQEEERDTDALPGQKVGWELEAELGREAQFVLSLEWRRFAVPCSQCGSV